MITRSDFSWLRIVQGIGSEQFQQSVTRKLPLVATDQTIFALAAELGWNPEWLTQKRQPVQPLNSSTGDVATVLSGTSGAPVAGARVSRRCFIMVRLFCEFIYCIKSTG